jgi:ABC-2 type transport system ATP-binding protein
MTPASTRVDIAIDVDGLTKSFAGRKVVKDLSLQVRSGTVFGFLGANGSGKTTTIRLLCGLLTPDAGHGSCLGFDIRTDTNRIKREVGYMTQRFSLYQDLSVRENLDFAARIHGLANPVGAVTDMMARLGLEGRREQLAGSLSGGWKQRLSLAACMLPSPRLLLLDEPTAGVDPTARREFWSEIHAFANNGLTVLVSTHYMDEAERCHEIAYLADGRLVTQGTVEAVIRKSSVATFAVSGEGLATFADELANIPGIDVVVPFGTSLHVCGRDATMLAAATERYRTVARQTWSHVTPSLEDVLITLLSGTREQVS